MKLNRRSRAGRRKKVLCHETKCKFHFQYNPDVYHLLKDSLEEPSRKLLLKTPPLLQWNVAQLLLKLRLLSYS